MRDMALEEAAYPMNLAETASIVRLRAPPSHLLSRSPLE